MKINKQSITLILASVCLLFVLVWALKYFNVDAVKYDVYGQTYIIEKISDKQYNLILSNYASAYPFEADPSIKVFIEEGDKRIVEIYGQQHLVEPADPSIKVETMMRLNTNNHFVTYPSGKQYFVEAGTMWHEYVPGKEREYNVTQLLDSPFIPSFVVHAAYEQFFEKQGNLKVFIAAFLLFTAAFVVFNIKKLQEYLFAISYLFVEEPTPTSFYFIFCKIVMAIVMFYAIIMFFDSL